MKIGFAQINPTVGDLSGNFEKIIHAYERLAAAGAELVLTPELAVTGYPPQDLVFKSRFVPENLAILFFDKDVAFAQVAADFLADNNSAEGRGDDRVAIKFAQVIGEPSTNSCRNVGMLKKYRALEILPAVQAGVQNEVAIEQGTSFAKKGEKIFAHGESKSARRQGRLRQHAMARALPKSGPRSRNCFAIGISILAGSVVSSRFARFSICDRDDFDFYVRSFR